jgi:hypothetical protein
MPEDVAVFAVRSTETALTIDPIVIVHYGANQRFKTIPSMNTPVEVGVPNSDSFDRLERLFYRPGSQVAMFRGAERLGAASIEGSSIEGKDGDCVNLTASVSWSGSSHPLLATSALSEISGHAPERRSATPSEVATLRNLAIAWLSEYGLDKQLLAGGSVGPVTSAVLRQNARRALVGRFDVESKRAIHRLFAIAEQGSGGYVLTLADFNAQRDLESEKDKEEQEYIDQLDIDNDGHDEVITSVAGYEGWSYKVWKFYQKLGVWSESYAGGGGGC